MNTRGLVEVVTVIVFVSLANAQSIRSDLKSHPNWKLLDQGDDCGSSVPQFRIIGGVEASLGQYPWLVRLGYSQHESNKEVDVYECGGAIISDKYILTAAHCGPDIMKQRLVSVAVGEHDTRTDPDCKNKVCAPPVQNIEVESVACHKEYSTETFYHDICLVRLAKLIEFSDYVQPICLPVYDNFLSDTFDGMIMQVAGWGLTNIDSYEVGETLQTLKVPVVPFNDCQEKFIDDLELTDKQMCAGGVVGQDSCSGDSGGPLMKPFAIEAPPRFFVVGVVSFGVKRCGESDTPGIYTKVAHYMTWILDNVKP